MRLQSRVYIEGRHHRHTYLSTISFINSNVYQTPDRVYMDRTTQQTHLSTIGFKSSSIYLTGT